MTLGGGDGPRRILEAATLLVVAVAVALAVEWSA